MDAGRTEKAEHNPKTQRVTTVDKVSTGRHHDPQQGFSLVVTGVH